MKTITLFVLLSLTTSFSLFGQVSSYTFQSTSGTYTPIIGGTVLGTTANDEQVFNNSTIGGTGPVSGIGFPIGFNFHFNGSVFDRFAVNTNGWITLGTGSFIIGGTITPISNIATSGFTDILSAMGRDMQGQTGSELSYKLIGTAPSRVLVVQWLDYRRFNIASGENFNFQIRLNETSNTINFDYGTVTTTNTSTLTASNPTQVGVRGASNSDFENRTTTTSWPLSTAGTLNSSTMRLTTTVGPASGLTYTWTPAVMTFNSCTTLQTDTSSVRKSSVNNQILEIPVVLNGTSSPLSITSFTVNTTGTTNLSDITNAKIWYTGTSPVFAVATQFGSTVSAPSGSYNITGTQLLTSGTNYFWLTYDTPLEAVVGNHIDAGCSSLTIGTARIPTVQEPAGHRTITTIPPLNGNYTIGLTMFNLILGKELSFKKLAKKVTRDIFAKSDNVIQKGPSNKMNFSGNDKRQIIEAEQDTFILMDGDMPFKGSQMIPVTADIRKKFGNLISDNVSGIYPNITTAVNDLNVGGVQGPVNFYLNDGTYSSETFPIRINNINGSSAVNTISIKPSAGVTPQIVMTNGESMIEIYSSSYITIDGSNSVNGTTRDLTFINNTTGASSCIWAGSTGTTTENNISIKNCIIKAGEDVNGSVGILFSDGDVSGNPGYFNNVTIQNNSLQKGKEAIFINGGTAPEHISNVNIFDNQINSTGVNAVGLLGIYLEGVNIATLRGNDIANFETAFDEADIGIWVALGSQNITVERNKIYDLGYTGVSGNGAHGIFITPDELNAAVLIKNNIIYNIYGDGFSYTDQYSFLDNPSGIVLFSFVAQSGISIFNNSINMYGNTLNQVLALSTGIFVSTGTTVDIRNNSITNSLGLASSTGYGSCAIYVQSSATQFLNIDYNNYFVNPTGTGVKAIGKISTTTTSIDINSWKTATGKDKSSLDYDPGLTSNTNLLPDVNSQNSWSLNGRGTQISTVSNDYNGTIRSISLSTGAPDIGAYEFTPVSQPPATSQIGTITNGGVTKFVFAGDTVASVTWHGVSLPSSVILKYFSGTNPPGTNPPGTLTGNYGNSYWNFITTGGSGYTFDITLEYDPALIGTITSESNISIANYTSNIWKHYDAIVNESLDYVTHNSINNLTTFTIDDKNVPLPVSILYFNALAGSRDVLLKWGTSSEINNSGFEIQRKSGEDTEWSKKGFVNGGGNSSTQLDYTFSDTKLNIGVYSYRIKQIDFNGNSEYFVLSSDITIGKPIAFGMSQNYPNPSNPKTKIDYQISNDGMVNIKVYDMQGKEITTIANGYMKAGYYTAVFDGTNLATGVYFYRITTTGFTQTMKMILVK